MRRSPTGIPHYGDEWPVLSPDRSKHSVAPEKYDVSALAAQQSELLDLSPSAAAVEKAMHESDSVGQPYQTRTSSLRARLSAGQLIPDSPATRAKTMGFTDFTTVTDDPAGTATLCASTGARDRSVSPARARLIKKNSSKEVLRDTGAAAFVKYTDVGAHESRPSSIPESRQSVPGAIIESGIEQAVTISTEVSSVGPSSTEPREVEGTSENIKLSRQLSNLEVIEESPKRGSPKAKTAALRKMDNLKAADPLFDASQDRQGNASSSARSVERKKRKPGTPLEEQRWVHPSARKVSDSPDDFTKNKIQDQLGRDPGSSSRDAGMGVTPQPGLEYVEGKATIATKQNATKAPEFRRRPDKLSLFPPRSSSRIPPDDSSNAPIASSAASAVHTAREGEHSHLREHPANLPGDRPTVYGVDDEELKRDSAAQESNKSRGSTSKGVISNIRGLFQKRSADAGPSIAATAIRKGKSRIPVAETAFPLPPLSDIHPVNRPAVILSSEQRVHTGELGDLGATMDTLSSSAAPLTPDELSIASGVVKQLLGSVHTERNVIVQNRKVEMAKVLVAAIEQAIKAEKAFEEAKLATREAEVASMMCNQSVREMTSRLKQWKEDDDAAAKKQR